MYDVIMSIFVMVLLIIILFLSIWPISLPLLIYYLIKRSKNRKEFKSTLINYSDKKEYKDIKIDQLSGFDINDLEKLKLYLYDIFYRFEQAYNSMDYNTMYNLSTSKLYNMYHTNIVLNSKFEEKKIIEAIELKRMIIFDGFASNYRQVVKALVEIASINYTQNFKGKIISGNPTKKVTEKFEVTFIKSLKDNKDHKCPNCGATINGTTCEYCQSKYDDSEFKIDSINKLV